MRLLVYLGCHLWWILIGNGSQEFQICIWSQKLDDLCPWARLCRCYPLSLTSCSSKRALCCCSAGPRQWLCWSAAILHFVADAYILFGTICKPPSPPPPPFVWFLGFLIEVSKGAKIRSRYNQLPHPTQDTNGKVTHSQLDTTNESQEVSPFPAGDHKAHINRRAQRHCKRKTEQKHKIYTKEAPPWNGQ